MCKVSGFADHAHHAAPCPKCHVTHDELFSEKAMRNGKSTRYALFYLVNLLGKVFLHATGLYIKHDALSIAPWKPRLIERNSSRNSVLNGQSLLDFGILTSCGTPLSIRCTTGCKVSSPLISKLLPSDVSLGMAKLQWYSMFIKRNVLRAPTATEPRELGVLHKFIESVRDQAFSSYTLN